MEFSSYFWYIDRILSNVMLQQGGASTCTCMFIFCNILFVFWDWKTCLTTYLYSVNIKYLNWDPIHTDPLLMRVSKLCLKILRRSGKKASHFDSYFTEWNRIQKEGSEVMWGYPYTIRINQKHIYIGQARPQLWRPSHGSWLEKFISSLWCPLVLSSGFCSMMPWDTWLPASMVTSGYNSSRYVYFLWGWALLSGSCSA